jgi:hypothetical protein
VFASLLLRECLHSGTLAGAYGGMHGGCCQAEGRRRKTVIILFLVLIAFIVIMTTHHKKYLKIMCPSL